MAIKIIKHFNFNIMPIYRHMSPHPPTDKYLQEIYNHLLIQTYHYDGIGLTRKKKEKVYRVNQYKRNVKMR